MRCRVYLRVMKKIIMVMVAMAILVPSVVSAVDIGVASIDVGVPVLYVNKNPIVDISGIGGQAPLWGLVIGNLRTGIEADLIFKVVPGVFGLGANIGVLAGVGSQPGTNGSPTFIADVPIRIAARLDIPVITGYVQVHGGIILENIITAGLTGFDVLRNVDLGVRLRLFQIAIEAGYLLEVADLPKNRDILSGAEAPFYVGLYIPIL